MVTRCIKTKRAAQNLISGLPPPKFLGETVARVSAKSTRLGAGAQPWLCFTPAVGYNLWSVSKHDGFDLSTNSGHRIRFGTVVLNG